MIARHCIVCSFLPVSRKSMHSMESAVEVWTVQGLTMRSASADPILLACSSAVGNSAFSSSKCSSYMHCCSSQHWWSDVSQSDQCPPNGFGLSHTLVPDFYAGLPGGLRLHASRSSKRLGCLAIVTILCNCKLGLQPGTAGAYSVCIHIASTFVQHLILGYFQSNYNSYNN